MVKGIRVALPLVLALVGIACGDLFTERTAGEKLWRKHCADCHGLNAAGDTPRYMGDPWADLTDDQWHVGGDESSITSVVREGVFSKMPANEKLTDDEVREVVAWLFHLRGGSGEVDELGEVE